MSLLLLLSFLSLIHDPPVNHIVCGIDVVVLPEKLTVRYQVGIADETIRNELKALNLESDGSPGAILQRYMDSVSQSLNQKLKLQVNQNPAVLNFVSSELSGKHHVRFICHFEYARDFNDSANPTTISIQDGSFPRLKKELKVAARGKRGVELLKSNVAGLLVRAESNEIWKAEPEKRNELTTAILTIAPNLERNQSTSDDLIETKFTPEKTAEDQSASIDRELPNKVPAKFDQTWLWYCGFVLLSGAIVVCLMIYRRQ